MLKRGISVLLVIILLIPISLAIGDRSDPGGNAGEGNECFLAGTKVIMAGGGIKNIEDITIGETVIGAGGDNKVIDIYHFS